MINSYLLNLMNETEKIEEKKIYSRTIDYPDLKLLKIRDYLMINAEIIDEDLKHNAYTAYFRSGILKTSRILVGLILEESKLTIASYSKNKNVDEKLVNKICNGLLDKSEINPRRKIKKYLFFILVFLISMLFVLGIYYIPSTTESTRNYNDAVSEFNATAEEYNEKVSMVSVVNIEGIPGKTDYLNTENDDLLSIGLNLLKGNLPNKIDKDTNTVNSMTEILNKSSTIIDNIYTPETD